ncbi:MAG TPA: glycosyl hydrolase family 28-related protein, partial [Candidatus Caenarcaniphilales bacterium]
GIINVKTVYGAKGDGITDDTQRLLKAIKENIGLAKDKTLYFPNGIYLVSNRLEWKDLSGNWSTCLTLQGQSREKTIIKLKDNTSGYSDFNTPKAVIYTASRNSISPLGEGNQAHHNNIYDLTVDVGKGNPGAIGIDFLANNKGTLRDVTIRSGDGQGRTGLALSRKWPGPCLIKNVQIERFAYGILAVHAEYSVTFVNITLMQQRSAGLHNNGNVLSIRGLTSTNTVPVIQNVSAAGLVTLLDGNFTGGTASVSAIDNQGALYVRNLTTSGYKSAIQNKGTVVPGNSHSEFCSHNRLSLFPSPAASLQLPVKAAPNYHNNDLSTWANVAAYGAKGDDWNNDTAAIQAAMDSGKSTIYFPLGRYLVSTTIRVRGSVKHIIGMESVLGPAWDSFSDTNNPLPFLRFESGTADAVIVERLNFGKLHSASPSPGVVWVEHASPKTLVLRDVQLGGENKMVYRNTLGAGELFLENVVGGKWRFDYPQNVWARHLNTEVNDLKIRNNGGKLWILGIKTENLGENTNRTPTVIETTGGGQTEVLGGLLYPVQPVG